MQLDDRRLKCRIWWPRVENPSPCASSSLFGWFLSCSSSSVDVVVALSAHGVMLSSFQNRLQELICETSNVLPVTLQRESEFCLVGEYVSTISENGKTDEETTLNDSNKARLNWIQVNSGSYGNGCRDTCWIPHLQSIRWQGLAQTLCDVRVIIYETPVHGLHHYSLNTTHFTSSLKRRPKWIENLNNKEAFFDLETVIVAINCAAAASKLMRVENVSPSNGYLWTFAAIVVSSISTVVYVILQFASKAFTFSVWSFLRTKIFTTSSAVIRTRCLQIIYWPIFLTDSTTRSSSCVEYSEKAAGRRNSLWSSLLIDYLLGNVIGLALLLNAECGLLWVSRFASDFTKLLRCGCVWLMGNPAGFKLNIELARALGMISLNATQAWCTLWMLTGFFFVYFIRLLALLGMLFGATSCAALATDVIRFSASHVLALQWVFSALYSLQTQAISSLWRLFRGRKWNPLRRRCDSYDYNVKQHVVGSLMFTPLLLLLPTTSVFYVFFTILKTSMTMCWVSIEIMISLVQNTPYADIIYWLFRPRKFPKGIWFQVLEADALVLVMQSNFLSLGEVVLPHYKKIFRGFGGFVRESAYGALSGKSTSTSCGCVLPLPHSLAWITLPCIQYWWLCYSSIIIQ